MKKRFSDKDLAEIPLGLAHGFGAVWRIGAFLSQVRAGSNVTVFYCPILCKFVVVGMRPVWTDFERR